jgi:hypothetical protein
MVGLPAEVDFFIASQVLGFDLILSPPILGAHIFNNALIAASDIGFEGR